MNGFQDPFQDPKVRQLLGQAVSLETSKPRTRTTKILMGTQINISVAYSEENGVQGYILQLNDQSENTLYMYQFPEEVRTILQKLLEDLPHVGEKVNLEEG